MKSASTSAPTSTAGRPLTLLFTCVGRRIELLQAFRAAARRAGVSLRIAATDSDVTAPGLYCADEPAVVPRAGEAGYADALLRLVERTRAAALIPTIDTDLRVISQNRDRFAALGCTALIGTPDAIEVCRDKLQTYRFLTTQGIDTPRTWTPEEIRAHRPLKFPYFLKPRYGSASESVHKIDDEADLAYFLAKGRDPIVQEFVAGREYTLDAYVGLTGQVRCVVPRLRWQVRSGEVSKGVVVKDVALMEAGRRVVEALGPSVRGLVTLQCIVGDDGRIRFIEINPRFGGGAPLSIAAGADFPAWLLAELTGAPTSIAFDGFRHGVCVLRYDWAVFTQLDADLRPQLRPPLREWPRFE